MYRNTDVSAANWLGFDAQKKKNSVLESFRRAEFSEKKKLAFEYDSLWCMRHTASAG